MRPSNTSGTKAGRKALNSPASVLGLIAGAIGWSGLANAASEETERQTLFLPDHYRLMDDGVVVFQLGGGEELSLNPNQYLILEDGLLLITDELAQASMETLPVVGAIRSQLISDVQPIRSPDGSVVLASDASPLWSGDGPAPRLFEEVDIQRYELASHSDDPTVDHPVGWNPVDGGLLAGGLLTAAGLLSNSPQEIKDELGTPVGTPVIDFSVAPTAASVFDLDLPPAGASGLQIEIAGIDLSQYGSDPDNDPLSYSVTNVTSNDLNGDDGVTNYMQFMQIYSGRFLTTETAGTTTFPNGQTDTALVGDTWTIEVTVSDGILAASDTFTVEW